MKKINSKDKGKRGERDFAKFLKKHGIEARRGIQFKGGENSPDVITDLKEIHFEVKFTEHCKIYDFIEQASKDAGDNKVPVVSFRRKHHNWLAILPMEDFIKIILESQK